MMDLATLFSSHERLHLAGGRWQIPRLTLTKVEIRPAAQGSDEAAELLRSCCGKPGWIRFRSAFRWTAVLTSEELAGLGAPLAGEWGGRDCSWRLVPRPEGGRRAAFLGYFEEGAGQAYLRQDVKVLARQEGPSTAVDRWLHYGVYWEIDAEGRATRAFDRFLGLSTADDGGSET